MDKALQFENHLAYIVQNYLDTPGEYGPDPDIAVDPKNIHAEIHSAAARDSDIYLSDATLEEAAVAEGLAVQDGMDYQASRNWDLYPLREYLRIDSDGVAHPDKAKLRRVVEKYLKYPDNSRTPYTE